MTTYYDDQDLKDVVDYVQKEVKLHLNIAFGTP